MNTSISLMIQLFILLFLFSCIKKKDNHLPFNTQNLYYLKLNNSINELLKIHLSKNDCKNCINEIHLKPICDEVTDSSCYLKRTVFINSVLRYKNYLIEKQPLFYTIIDSIYFFIYFNETNRYLRNFQSYDTLPDPKNSKLCKPSSFYAVDILGTLAQDSLIFNHLKIIPPHKNPSIEFVPPN